MTLRICNRPSDVSKFWNINPEFLTESSGMSFDTVAWLSASVLYCALQNVPEVSDGLSQAASKAEMALEEAIFPRTGLGQLCSLLDFTPYEMLDMAPRGIFFGHHPKLPACPSDIMAL
jgi:hypothetical protein